MYGGPQGCVEQFWEPGFYFPNPEFHALMLQLEQSPWIVRLQPAGGTTLYLDKVKLTVLGPGVGLKSRFDTYGVNVNDSSITLMIEYPASGLYLEVDPNDPARRNRRFPTRRTSHRLLLGGDAQFTSWAQTAIDFPDLQQLENRVLARELRAARGPDHLSADLFKLSHHASKHGVNVELLERVDARHAFVSSVAGGGSYNFPHALAMEAAREARQQIAKSGLPRLTDHELGIHVTGSHLDDAANTPLGSIAALVPPSSGQPIRLFRLMDTRAQPADLTGAREIGP